ncbi:hypothetical protein [Streptomyces sp. NPDC050560]|uniref:hypothetical protein n=1 Tax=Streptomyces sp. NPDC050560 TaxID=3365630 RepID=UPI0037A37847
MEEGSVLNAARHGSTPRLPLTPAARGAEDRGDTCDLVTVPARQGLEAFDILRRGGAEAVGPVLHDGSCDTLGFVVPPGTADAWDVPGSACAATLGRGIAAGSAPPVAGTGWLLPPGEAYEMTDPAVLRAALGEAARMLAAADNCS